MAVPRTAVELWDAARTQRLGRDWDVETHATREWNSPGMAEVTVDNDHPMALAARQVPAAVLRVLVDGREFVGGRVSSVRGTQGPNGRVSITAVGWMTELNYLYAWPVPLPYGDPQLMNALQYPPAAWSAAGPIETVVKTLVSANVARRNHPFVVMSSDGRGANITLTARLVPIMDVISNPMDYSGLVWGVTQAADGALEFDAQDPVTHRLALDTQGVVSDLSWEVTAPKATMGLGAGGGAGLARGYSMVTMADDALWHRETFVDASGIQPSDTFPMAQVNIAVGDKVTMDLREQAARTSLQFDLQETIGFAYRAPYEVGDLVTVDLGGGWVATDRIVSAELSVTTDEGVVITPTVGGVKDTPDDRVARAMRSTRVGLRVRQAG